MRKSIKIVKHNKCIKYTKKNNEENDTNRKMEPNYERSRN